MNILSDGPRVRIRALLAGSALLGGALLLHFGWPGGSAGSQTREDAAPLAGSTSVVVSDTGGGAVAGCTVILRTDDECRRLGQTDAGGALLVPKAAVAGAWLAARHPDFAQADVAVPAAPPAELRLRLMPGASLKGVVRRTDGSAPVTPASVVAHRIERIPRMTGRRSWSDENPALHRARADDSGRFELRGLEPGQRYALRAGGAGWLSADSLRVTAPQEAIPLEVLPLFGARVRLHSSAGGAPPGSPALVEGHGEYVLETDPELRELTVGALELVLAGADVSDTAPRPWEHLLVHGGSSDVESLQPTSIRFHVPGFAEHLVEIPMPRFRGELHVEEVELVPDGKGWTELSLRWEGGPRLPLAASEEQRASHRLELRRSDGRVYSLALCEAGIRDVETHRIPAGQYEWALVSPRSRYPAGVGFEQVEWKGPRDALTLPWPDGTGALLLELALPSGVPHEGPWRLFHRRGGAAEDPYVVTGFDGSPALLCSLPAGEWELFAAPGLAPPPAVRSATTPVRVRSGEVTVIELAPSP